VLCCALQLVMDRALMELSAVCRRNKRTRLAAGHALLPPELHAACLH